MLHFSLIVFTVLQLSFGSAQDIKPENQNFLDVDDNPNWWKLGSSTPPSNQDSRIIGGQEAFIKDHPYLVSYLTQTGLFCGGFIVSENYILTAAHCVQDVEPAAMELRAGSSDRNKGVIIPIAEVTPHPEYNVPLLDKDVAVMKTVEPITLSDTVQPIDLPEMNRPMIQDTNVVVSGWGYTEEGGQISDRLMDVEISVIYWLSCYGTYVGILTRNMWCGGNHFLGGQGTCEGDSGSAATQNGLAVGIVSFGRGCAELLSPNVFTDIAAPTIRTFITEHTGL